MPRLRKELLDREGSDAGPECMCGRDGLGAVGAVGVMGGWRGEERVRLGV